jgi:outer membrane immunogenic protein
MRKYGLIKLGLAAVMLTSMSASSEAADVSGGPAYPPSLPPIPFVYNWTGFYAGAHVGVGWSDGDGSGSSGFISGGQVGFNYQINQWVLGVEGDFAGTTIKDSVNATVVGPGAVITGNAEASLDWVSTLAPRVGYAFNNWLVYGKVGGAWAHASGTASAEEPYDLITVLTRLEGIGREISRGHPVGDDGLGATATAGQTGLFQKNV